MIMASTISSFTPTFFIFIACLLASYTEKTEANRFLLQTKLPVNLPIPTGPVSLPKLPLVGSLPPLPGLPGIPSTGGGLPSLPRVSLPNIPGVTAMSSAPRSVPSVSRPNISSPIRPSTPMRSGCQGSTGC